MSFPDDWSYRRKITISGSSGAGAGYQVLFKIGENSDSSDYDFHLGNKSAKFPSQQNDSGDLRFTLDDGTTLLPFWVEKVEGTSPNRTAHIWVKVNADLNTDQNIYIYFGNANAGNASNGEETFEFFDDATYDKLSEYRFVTSLSGPTSGSLLYDSQNKEYIMQHTEYDYDLLQIENVSMPNCYVKVTFKFASMSSYNDRFSICLAYNGGLSHSANCYLSEVNVDATKISICAWNGYSCATFAEQTLNEEIQADVYYDLTTFRYDGNFGMSLEKSDGTLLGTTSGSDTTYSYDKIGLSFGWNSPVEVAFKNLFVKKYVDPEPTFDSVDNIESLPILQGTVCDKNGNPITGTSVKIFLLDKDTGKLLKSTTSNSEDGSWNTPFWATTSKTLAVFALEGTYGEDTDIAGAEFLETE